MTTKAIFECERCGNREEFSICTICYGVIDFPHNPHPKCGCGGRMSIVWETITKLNPELRRRET